MILPDSKRRSLINAALRTTLCTRPAPDAGIRDMIALFFYYNISQGVCLAENRIAPWRFHVTVLAYHVHFQKKSTHFFIT